MQRCDSKHGLITFQNFYLCTAECSIINLSTEDYLKELLSPFVQFIAPHLSL